MGGSLFAARVAGGTNILHHNSAARHLRRARVRQIYRRNRQMCWSIETNITPRSGPRRHTDVGLHTSVLGSVAPSYGATDHTLLPAAGRPAAGARVRRRSARVGR